MEQNSLKIILTRFKRSDYPYLVTNWGPLSTDFDVDVQKISKSEFVTAVAKKLKKEVTAGLVADLDLFYQQRYPNKKLWKVLKIDKISESNPNNVSTVTKLEKCLRRQILSYLDAEVHCREHHHAYWTRVAVKESLRSTSAPAASPSVGYIVHLPKTDYVVITGIKMKHREYLMQSFLTVLHGHRVTDCHLSGHHLASLLQLVLTKHVQGTDLVDSVGEERISTEEPLPDNISNENREEKRRREEYIQENFGPRKQPRLEKIEYKLETKFKGLKQVPSMAARDQIFHCRVKFEGSDVLEGLRNLAAAGLAEYPMKPHIGRVHTIARNKFVLKENVKRSSLV